MKITILKAELKKGLDAIGRFAESKSPLPVLAATRLELREDGRLFAECTDLDCWGRIELEYVAAEDPGVAVVMLKALGKSISGMLAGQLHIETTGAAEQRQLVIRQGSREAKLPLWPTYDYPTFPESDTDGRAIPLNVKLGDLQELCRRIIHAVSSEESRFQMSGALMTPVTKKAGLRGVATDGHRLSVAEIPAVALPLPKRLAKDDAGRRIVPRGVLAVLPHLPPGELTDLVQVSLGRERCRFTCGAWEVSGQTLKGTFPDFERIMARNNPYKVLVSRSALLAAAKELATFLKGKATRARSVRLDFGASLGLRAHNDDCELSREVPLAEGMAPGMSVRLGVNPTYLKDALAACSEDEVLLTLKDENTQIVLSPRGSSLPRHEMIVMPMRL